MQTRSDKGSLKGSSFEDLNVETNVRGSMVSREHRLNSTTRTKRDSEAKDKDLGIFKVISSRSKLEE